MRIRCEDKTANVPQDTSVLACLKATGVNTDGVLAVLTRGTVMEMEDAVHGDCEMQTLTLRDEEGRRIYERSLRFVLLLALRRLWPGQQVRIEFSVGQGVLVRLPGQDLTKDDMAAIEREMRDIIAADLPFKKKTWKLQDAIDWFAQDGQADKTALLKLRTVSYFTMYGCGGMWEYFYGAMAPSTGYVDRFGLTYRPDRLNDFALRRPSGADPSAPSPFIARPKHLGVFAESAKWCAILGVTNAADLAALTEAQMRDFIRVNEALHDKSIARIAQNIVDGGKRVILVAGPSSSGKTTFARRLNIHLRVLGKHPVLVSLDDYYLDRDKIPPEPDGSIDLESIHTLDLPLLQRQVTDLVSGKETELPIFNFKTQRREPRGRMVTLPEGEPVIFEGIHGMNPMLSEGMPQEQIHRVFVSALTCLNLDDHNRIRTTDVRLLRRIVRDSSFRGTPPDGTLSMWESVRRGEETWIFPYQENADDMFNTALHYELPFLKSCVAAQLERIPEGDPNRLAARRLLKTLNYIPAAPQSLRDEIPPTSILREFIGGLTFDED